jgi:outer membrane protein insertion porin family
MLLTSAEYRFPLTADDNLYGSFFIDAGTVEESVEINNFRVTPGFELRVNIPALGPVPLAIGIGVPIVHAPGDDIQNFHFFVGVSR